MTDFCHFNTATLCVSQSLKSCQLLLLIVMMSFLLSSPAAQPVLFKTQLQNLERQAGESACLRCETTKPGASVVWRCGDRVLASSNKYCLKHEGTVVGLVIYKLLGADSGEYSCDTGSQRTSAVLTVQGRSCYFLDCPFHSSSELFLHVLCHSNTLACHASTFHLVTLFAVFLTASKYSSIFSYPICAFFVVKRFQSTFLHTFHLSLITDLIYAYL